MRWNDDAALLRTYAETLTKPVDSVGLFELVCLGRGVGGLCRLQIHSLGIHSSGRHSLSYCPQTQSVQLRHFPDPYFCAALDGEAGVLWKIYGRMVFPLADWMLLLLRHRRVSFEENSGGAQTASVIRGMQGEK